MKKVIAVAGIIGTIGATAWLAPKVSRVKQIQSLVKWQEKLAAAGALSACVISMNSEKMQQYVLKGNIQLLDEVQKNLIGAANIADAEKAAAQAVADEQEAAAAVGEKAAQAAA